MADTRAAADPRRWTILALLFAARTVMAMQYQAIGALSPVLTDRFGIGLAEIGVLIGLYVAPGLIFALPGSTIGQRFGERPVVAVSLGLMGAGAVLMASTDRWEVFVAGHVIAGFGGVVINILLTKMVTDWFAGAEITTALAIFINSWPFGIAVALVLFPPLVSAFGLASAFWILAILSVGVAALVVRLYRAPDDAVASGGPKTWPKGRALRAVLAAGLCWGTFNGGLAVMFGLGTALMVGQGVGPEEAARATSLILWTLAVAAPIGGVIADRTGRGREMIALGVVVLAGLAPLALAPQLTFVVFLAFGVFSGIVAGPIMGLPARVLAPAERIAGMGLFFTVYYVVFVSAPALAGVLADASGRISAAFWSAAGFELAALLALVLYVRAADAIRG